MDSKLSQILNIGRMVAPCGTRKRFRDIFASSLDYMGLVAPERLSPCRSSRCPAACLEDSRGLGTTAVFGISQRLLPPTICGNPNPDASFDRGCCKNEAPLPVGGRPENDNRKIQPKNITRFGSIRLMIGFAACFRFRSSKPFHKRWIGHLL